LLKVALSTKIKSINHCWKQLRITLLRVCAMHFMRIYLSGTQ
jgi:hypothetical protein